MRAARHFIAPLLLFLFGSSEVSAQPTVEARLEKIEQTIRVLERRIEAQEEQQRQRNALPTVAADKVNWRKLQQGMPMSEVENLLGSPERIDASSVFTHWHYGGGRGRVTFDGKSRIVSAWNEP